jgi:Domain of unknown function (DUF222)/HNH endonuclease
MTAIITTAIEATGAGCAPVSLDERVASACGHLNAAWAHLADLVREVIETGTWHGVGIRSAEQWISWRTGLAAHHAHTLVALAGAVEAYPSVCERFAAGELSVDQAALAIKASPEHDGDIAEMATAMTLSQLRVAVRASNVSTAERHASEPNDAHGDDAEQESVPAPQDREQFSLRPDEDGTWSIHGRLDADHGAILDAALSEARDRRFHEGRHDVTWVDALIDVARRSMETVDGERGERFRINVFVDPQHSPTATWINGIAVPDAIKRLLGCDGRLSPIFVTNGKPTSVGRSQRIVPERTRRIVLYRDKQCRNPLCRATRGLEVHHLVHWLDGGPTDTWNLIALCSRCHRDHHLGRLGITGNADQPDGVAFFDQYGRAIDPATHAKPTGPRPVPQRPYRHPRGERLQRWAIVFNPPRRPSTN